MNLFKTGIQGTDNKLFINLDNVVAISPNNRNGNAIIDCIGDDDNRSYFTNENFEKVMQRILRGDLLGEDK